MKGITTMKRIKNVIVVMELAVIAATVSSCKKENEVNIVSNEQNLRKPIAVYDNNSGLITTLIDAEALNIKFNESFHTNKDFGNRFVAESVEILDSVPHNIDVAGEIKITVLDTEEECSYSIWCMKSYVVKDVKEQQVDYYLDEDVANGNYDFAFKEGDVYYVADFLGDSLSIHEIDSLDYVCRPQFAFVCKSRNCEDNCTKGGDWYSAWCHACPLSNGDCEEVGMISHLLSYLNFF